MESEQTYKSPCSEYFLKACRSLRRTIDECLDESANYNRPKTPAEAFLKASEKLKRTIDICLKENRQMEKEFKR